MKYLTTILLTALITAPAPAADWSGYVSLESRTFASEAQFGSQSDESLSLAFEPEFFHEWDDGSQQFVFTPFVRIDSADDERTHFEIRELYWLKAARSWEVSVGFRQVFWGVTESQHLVDIINQTDLVEDPDGEQKLGQPMIAAKLVGDWGNLDLFLLTGFLERTFPGRDGRLRTSAVVDTDHPIFESDDEDAHIDWAIRWSNYFGPVDLGISHFSGTGRDPRFVPTSGDSGAFALRTWYELIDQTGLDMQITSGSALWKLEMIRRDGSDGDYYAATGGIEYTFSDIRSTGVDVGALVEYLWDERDALATTPFEKDVFVGSRIALNDVQDTQILVGAIKDLDTDATFFNLEASRRLGSVWTLTAKARAFSGVPESDPLTSFRDDDYLQLELARHF